MKVLAIIVTLLVSSLAVAEGLIKAEALNGKVSIMAPENFGPMAKDMLELKYPNSRRPTEVLSNSAGSVTLVFNHTQNAMQPFQLRDAHPAISQSFHNLYPSAQWFRDEVIEQNGSEFIVLELITPAIDTKIHNIMYATSVEGRFLLVAFNTTVEESSKWLPVGKAIMASLKIH